MALNRKNVIALTLVACVGLPIGYGAWKVTSWVSQFVSAIEEGTKASEDNQQAANRAADRVAKALGNRDQTALGALASRQLAGRSGASTIVEQFSREPSTIKVAFHGFIASPEKLLTSAPDVRNTDDAFRVATSPERAKGLIKGMVGALNTAVYAATAKTKAGSDAPLTIVLVREAGVWRLDDIRQGHPTEKDLEPDVSVLFGHPPGSLKR